MRRPSSIRGVSLTPRRKAPAAAPRTHGSTCVLRARSSLAAVSCAASVALAIASHAGAQDAEPTAPPLPAGAQSVAPPAPAPLDPSAPDRALSPAQSAVRASVAPPPESTFRVETRHTTLPNVALLATGAALFGLAYLPAVVGAGLADSGYRHLYVPVGGPWLALARAPDETAPYTALLALDGVAQGLGALLLLSSLFVPERVTHSWYLLGAIETRRPDKPVWLAPGRVGSGYGLGARGRF